LRRILGAKTEEMKGIKINYVVRRLSKLHSSPTFVKVNLSPVTGREGL
jgi:hypothetical protein